MAKASNNNNSNNNNWSIVCLPVLLASPGIEIEESSLELVLPCSPSSSSFRNHASCCAPHLRSIFNLNSAS